MDKEAQENLIELRDALDFQINEWWGGLRQEPYASNYRRSLMSLLKNLGYRKLPDKPPPLLSDEEIGVIFTEDPKGQTIEEMIDDTCNRIRQVAQAQRESDIKHYEEVKD